MKYKVNNIFDENSKTLSELISAFLISFLDKEFSLTLNDVIIKTDIISDL